MGPTSERASVFQSTTRSVRGLARRPRSEEAATELPVASKIPHPSGKDVIGASATNFKATSAAGRTAPNEIALVVLAGDAAFEIVRNV